MERAAAVRVDPVAVRQSFLTTILFFPRHPDSGQITAKAV